MDLGRRPPRASPSSAGRPPPPPRVLRSSATALGMALVAALDELPARAPAAPNLSPFLPPRPRSDSTLSSDTFDGIYALGDDDVGAVDVDDVDMDDLQCVDADADAEVDVFRPSALLDRKLEDEYGRASDLERMLSSLDDGGVLPAGAADLADVHGMEVDDDEATAVMAHLAQLDALQKTAVKSVVPVAVPTANGAVLLLPPTNGARRVVVHPVGGAETVDAATAALPPRAAPGDSKRRAHKRTFGERAATFRFGGASMSSSPAKFSASTSAITIATTTTTRSRAVPTTTTSGTTTRRARSLFHEAAEDIAGRRDVGPAGNTNNENTPPLPPVAASSEDHDHDMCADDQSPAAASPVATAQTPVRATEAAIAGSATTATTTTTTAGASAFHTPLRRAASCGVSTSSVPTSASAFLTPSAATASSTASPAGGAISPALTLDKVAVVHAKDTPGKVDKFEWTIRRGSRSLAATASPTTAAELPPPYLRDAASATPKRRVHSSTFGSFARSFSFTTP